MTAIATGVVLALPILIALAALRVWSPSPRGALEDLTLEMSLAIGIGLGVSSCFYFLWLILFGGSRLFVLVEAAVLAALLAAWIRRRRREPRPRSARVIRIPDTTQRGPRWIRPLLLVVFGLLIVVSTATFAARSAARPHGGWDATTIWNMRARFLFRGADQWRAAFSDQLGVWTHTDYPVLLPGSIARAWTAIGDDTTLVPALVAALFAAATVGLLVAAVTRLRGLDQGLMAGIVLLGSRTLARQGATQYADIPLGLFVLAALVSIALWQEESEQGPYLVLSGLCVGLAAWTKNEGLLFLLVFLLGFAYVSLGPRWNGPVSWRPLRALAVGLLPVLALVVGFKWLIAPTNDLVAAFTPGDALRQLTDLERYALVAASFGMETYRFGGWLVSMPLVLSAYLLIIGLSPSARPRPALLLGAICLTLLLAGYFAVFVLSPHDLDWHLEVSLYRLILHVWPALLFLLFLMARGPGRALTRRMPAGGA